MHQITPFATKMPYQVLLGNHEANGWGFGKFAGPQQVDSGGLPSRRWPLLPAPAAACCVLGQGKGASDSCTAT